MRNERETKRQAKRPKIRRTTPIVFNTAQMVRISHQCVARGNSSRNSRTERDRYRRAIHSAQSGILPRGPKQRTTAGGQPYKTKIPAFAGFPLKWSGGPRPSFSDAPYRQVLLARTSFNESIQSRFGVYLPQWRKVS